MTKKVLKQDVPRKEDGRIELLFRVRFYPVDVTQVLQYATLYQTFLASRQSVLRNELEISNKDAFMLASLWLQATRGDYDEAEHTLEVRICGSGSGGGVGFAFMLMVYSHLSLRSWPRSS